MIKTDKKIKSHKSNWEFNKSVTDSFESHVTKSVPFYDVSHSIVEGLSDFFLKDKSTCYDLGCSTGTLLSKLKKRHSSKKISFIGYDQSKFMIKKAKKNHKKIKFLNQDITKTKFKKNDLTLSLYTMQFVQPKKRQLLINKIYKSLEWGGAFVLFEKIRGKDARFQDILNFLYFDFKRQNGLSDKQILNKEISLRSVMEPYTINANIDFLKRAGFKDIMPISQYLSFIGLLAIK